MWERERPGGLAYLLISAAERWTLTLTPWARQVTAAVFAQGRRLSYAQTFLNDSVA